MSDLSEMQEIAMNNIVTMAIENNEVVTHSLGQLRKIGNFPPRIGEMPQNTLNSNVVLVYFQTMGGVQ